MLFLLLLLNSIKFTVCQGREEMIDFTSGSELLIAKAKNGHLSVVRSGIMHYFISNTWGKNL